MTIAASDIQAMPSGEFASISDSVCDDYIALATSLIDSATWGSLFDSGVKYLTCHFLSLDISGSGGASGPMTAMSSGPVSMSFGAYLGYSGNADQYQSTSYGRMFMAIQSRLGIVGFVT